jgi:hypothetical protein
MNIFMLSYEPNPYKHFMEQAAFHCDKHVIKMIAESTQMLVTALSPASTLAIYYKFNSCKEANLPCKPLTSGHAKHPCVRWTGASINHVYYLLRLALALCSEKNRRWPLNQDHAYHTWLLDLADDFRDIGYSVHDPLPDYFPVAVKNELLRSTARAHHEVVAIYREYYARDKASIATWKAPAAKPMWFALAVKKLEVI